MKTLPRTCSKATSIVEEARKRDVEMRILGACAFRIHCPHTHSFFETVKRPITDIDLITLGKFRDKVTEIMRHFGFTPNERFNWVHGGRRYLFHLENELKADVFFDKLEMSHIIDLRERLTVDYPTISVADMLLEKTQIVKIAEKDIVDLIALLLEHPIGGDDVEKVNVNYISKLLSDDWGFYYTCTSNLRKIEHFLAEYSIPAEDKETVSSRIKELVSHIEAEPKSLKWRMRQRLGERVKWYSEVSDVST